MPTGRSRRHMLSREVVVLVTGAAFHAQKTVSIRAAPHIHGVPVPIVSLSREISPGVAVHTPRVMQHLGHGLKGADSLSFITRRGSINVVSFRGVILTVT